MGINVKNGHSNIHESMILRCWDHDYCADPDNSGINGATLLIILKVYQKEKSDMKRTTTRTGKTCQKWRINGHMNINIQMWEITIIAGTR